MNTYYEKWLAREYEWAKFLDKKQKKSLCLYLIATPVGCIAALAIIGLMSGGGMELAVSNAKYGAIFGIVMDLVLFLVLASGMPGKRYKKQLLKMLAKELPSPAGQEEFAAQMMGAYGEDTVRRITWKDRTTGQEQVWVTKDYVMRTTGTGFVSLIQLKQIREIELDVQEYMRTAGSGNAKIRYKEVDFPIIFRRKEAIGQPEGWKEKLLSEDPSLIFGSRSIRDQVVEAIQQVTEA